MVKLSGWMKIFVSGKQMHAKHSIIRHCVNRVILKLGSWKSMVLSELKPKLFKFTIDEQIYSGKIDLTISIYFSRSISAREKKKFLVCKMRFFC